MTGDTTKLPIFWSILIGCLNRNRPLLQVAKVTATPADRSAEALSLAVALESGGLVHLVVRRAAQDTVVTRDHTIVHKATHKVNGTSSSSQKVNVGVGAGVGVAKVGEHAALAVTETVQDLEPNSAYEVWHIAACVHSEFSGCYCCLVIKGYSYPRTYVLISLFD